jgi:hypothetical protein
LTSFDWVGLGWTGLDEERFKKYCSRLVEWDSEAVFLGFGFVSAQSQAAAGDSTIRKMHRKADAMLPRQSLAKTQKSSLQTATVFLKTL